MSEQKKCNRVTEVFSRIVGYYRPVARWNKGKQEEFAERKTFDKSIGKFIEVEKDGKKRV